MAQLDGRGTPGFLPAERQSTSTPPACLLLRNTSTVGWLASRCALREHRRASKLLVALATFGSPDESMPIRRSAAASGPGVPDGRCN